MSIVGKITVAFQVAEVTDDGQYNPLAPEIERRSRFFCVEESDVEFREAVQRRLDEYDAKRAALAETRGATS